MKDNHKPEVPVWRCSVPCEGTYKNGQPCRNTASYSSLIDGCSDYRCKSHASQLAGVAVEMPKEPTAIAAKRRQEAARQHAAYNKAQRAIRVAAGQPGKVCVGPRTARYSGAMLMPGFTNVRPNFFQRGYDGDASIWSGDEQSPMAMGPIPCLLPRRPDVEWTATCIENLWQSHKVFACDMPGYTGKGPHASLTVADSESTDQDSLPIWHAEAGSTARANFDPVSAEALVYARKLANHPDPHRHKYSRKTLTSIIPGATKTDDINAPLFSQWWGVDGKRHRYTYIASRAFYCVLYEWFVERSPKLAHMRDLMANEAAYLRVIGPDCTPTSEDILCGPRADAEAWAMQSYMDPDVPFGHEMVLACLLSPHMLRPWRRYIQENVHMYRDGFPWLFQSAADPLVAPKSPSPKKQEFPAKKRIPLPIPKIQRRQKSDIALKRRANASPSSASPSAEKVHCLGIGVVQGAASSSELGVLARSDAGLSRGTPEARAARVAILRDTLELVGGRMPLTVPTVHQFRPPLFGMKICVINANCIDVTIEKARKGKRVTLLDMANGTRAGGGALDGARAQEESICRVSNLLPVLESAQVAYPLTMPFHIVRNVTICKNGSYASLDAPLLCDVIVANARNCTRSGWDESAVTTTQKKINAIIKACILNRSEVLVLSAFGCGAFRCPPDQVAALFKEALQRQDVHFEEVIFAIMEDHNAVTNKHAPDGNLKPFMEAFGK